MTSRTKEFIKTLRDAADHIKRAMRDTAYEPIKVQAIMSKRPGESSTLVRLAVPDEVSDLIKADQERNEERD